MRRDLYQPERNSGVRNKTICPGCLFSVIDGKSKSVKDFLYGMPVDKIEQYIEKYV